MKKRLLPIPMIRFFLRQLRPYTPQIIALGMLGALMGLGMGYVGEFFYGAAPSLMVSISMALFAVVIIRSLLSIFSERLAVNLVADFRAKISENIFSQMDRYKLKWSSSEALERFTGDLPVLIDSFSQSFIYLTSQLVLLFIVMGIVAIKFPMGLLLIALGTLIYMTLALIIKPQIQQKTAIARKHEARLFQIEHNLVDGFEYLKTSNQGSNYFQNFIQKLGHWKKNERNKVTISAITENISWSLRFVFVVLILGSFVEGMGILKVDLYWLFLAVGSSSQVFWSIYRYGQILPLAQRCEDFFEEDVSSGSNLVYKSDQIQILAKNLFLKYDPRGKNQKGVGPFTFSWKRSTRSWIKGPSGSGKTTLLRTLLGLHGAYEGGLEAPSSTIGYVEQDPFFFDGESLAVNLGISNSLEINQDMVSQLGLSDFFSHLPEGINTIIGREGLYPSRGQKVRLALLRALLSDPNVLILDEPTAGLEKELAQQILLYVKRVMSHGILVVADHREDLISFLEPTQVLDINAGTQKGALSWRPEPPKDLSSF